MGTLRLTIAQLKPYIANPDKNLKKMENTIKTYAAGKADLIVFPELFLLGYYSKDLIYRLAESKNSKRIRAIIQLAKNYDINIITGFAEYDDKFNVVYNSALLATPYEDLKVYRKMHLPDFSVFDEARYFRRWDGDVELWDIKGFKCGVLICYDIFYPELSRAYTYMGANVLISISATPDFSRPLFHILSVARAIENTVYFIWVNNVGTFDGIGFAGGSRIVGPLGKIIYDSPLIKEDIKTIEISYDEIKIAREKRPVIKDITKKDVELIYKSYMLNTA